MNTVIFYDRDPDGIAAAITVALNRGMTIVGGTLVGADIDFRPAIRYEGPDLEGITKETTVYIVDFCYKGKFMGPLCKAAKAVIVIDHHGESTDKDLDGFTADNLFISNEIHFSACVNAWRWFNEASLKDTGPNIEYAPALLTYIQDMDLWQWKLEDSAEVAAAIDTWEPTIASYAEKFDTPIAKLAEEGAAIIRYKNKTIGILEKQAVLMHIAGYTVPAVNCSDPALVSYLGNRLSEGHPFAATYYLQPNGKWKFSVRSKDNGVNVRDIASQFGGGGHERASGFKVDQLFPFELIEEMETSR